MRTHATRRVPTAARTGLDQGSAAPLPGPDAGAFVEPRALRVEAMVGGAGVKARRRPGGYGSAMDAVDLNLLPALHALLTESSVTQAARAVGLSTPAMSHALARLRERLDDPLLVRAGRGMVLTPRAQALRPQVQAALAAAQQALSPERPFEARALDHTAVVHATDHVLALLGGPVDRILRAEAPGLCLRVLPNSPDDAALLRDEGSDLAVGIYGELPQEMRIRPLLTDRFVCVARRAHPTLGDHLDLTQFLALRHVQVAPRGRPGGYVDDVLAAQGLQRRVARAVPYFLSALQLVAESDDLLTVSERLAQRWAGPLGLRIFEAPLALRPYALSLIWHPRVDQDPAHRFLRETFVRAAQEVAGERHAEARARLDPSDPTSGQGRRRPKLQPMKG